MWTRLPPTRKRTRLERARSAMVFSLILALLGGPPAVAQEAAEIEDIPFPRVVTVDEDPLPLFGLGLLRYRVLFRGYVGGLYLPPDATPAQTFEDVPKVLELYYFWDIAGRMFGEAADEHLRRTQKPETLAPLRARLERLHRLYEDVEVGDRYRLTYLPGKGMTLAHNGKELGTIEGADFANVYFSIWLGTEPLNEAFRDQMFDGL